MIKVKAGDKKYLEFLYYSKLDYNHLEGSFEEIV